MVKGQSVHAVTGELMIFAGHGPILAKTPFPVLGAFTSARLDDLRLVTVEAVGDAVRRYFYFWA